MAATAARDRDREGWKELCKRAEEMVAAGEGQVPERGFKMMITELLGGLKTATKTTERTIEQVATAAAQKVLQQSQKGSSASSGRTWASVASLPPKPTQKTTVQVYITDQEEQRALEQMTGRQIVEKIGLREVVGAKASSKGVLKLFTAQEADRRKLEATKEWTLKIGKTAKVSAQRYMVIAHGMKRTFKPETDTIHLQSQNQNTCPGIQIAKTAWIKRQTDETKKESSLIVWINTAEQANMLLDQGLFWNYERMDTEIHQSSHRIMQCYRCQQYGHIAAKCSQPKDICSHCAGHHKVKECTSAREDTRCACCGRKHPSWSNQCPVRIAAQAKARDARICTPARYSTDRKDQTEGSKHSLKRKGPADGFATAGGRTSPHPAPGRPRHLDLAGRDSSQSRISFTSSSQGATGSTLDPGSEDSPMEDDANSQLC